MGVLLIVGLSCLNSNAWAQYMRRTPNPCFEKLQTKCDSTGSVTLASITLTPANAIVCLSNNITAETLNITSNSVVRDWDANHGVSDETNTSYISPVPITNWWAVTGVTATNNTGSGTNATFQPISTGTGTITFYCTYSNAPPGETTMHTSSNSATFTVIKVELFRDAACTKALDDWPEDTGSPRLPKYLFGSDNDIFIRVTGPAGLGNAYFVVQVTSESDATGIPINLREVSSGIYRNDSADGELLRLSDTSSQGAPADYIKVIDEEVLTFAAKANGTEVCLKDVKVDRAEIGVEWQSDYDTYDPLSYTYHTLYTADDFATGIYDNIGDSSLSWFKNFNNGDIDSKESHFASWGDSSWADAMDIVVWTGHAPPTHYLRFFVDLVGGVKQPVVQFYWDEIAWGDKDADWVVLNTCNFLNGTDAQLQAMANGVHLICGYATDMTIFAAAGHYFADQLEERQIRDAWHKQCEQYQPSGNTARVFGGSENGIETFQYGGPVLVARDPSGSSTYTHWDYTKP